MSRRTSLRDRIFHCRTRTTDQELARIQVFFGLFAFLHPASSLVLLSLKTGGTFLLPLLVFCVEITVASCFMIFVVVCDLLNSRIKTFSVWQREAVGRLLRNFTMGLLLTLSLLTLYNSLDARMRLTEQATFVFLPAAITAGVGVLKVAIVHSSQSWFWGCIFCGSLVQVLLLVCKLDYRWSAAWPLVLIPLYVLVLAVAVIFVLTHEESWWRLAMRTAACGLALAVCVLQEFAVQEAYKIGLAWGALAALTVSSSEAFGGFLLDILWGHVEIDFNYRQSPVQLKRMHTF